MDLRNNWEYRVLRIKPGAWGVHRPEQITEALNKEGRSGWELVYVVLQGLNHLAYFKRPR